MLYLITNRKLIHHGTLTEVVGKATKGGVDVIILREKDLSFQEILPIAVEIKEKIKHTNAKLIVNGSMDVARKINAHGFHCSFEFFIREEPKFNGLIGVSVHSLKEAIEGEERGASYILASPIFETQCKKGVGPKGIDFIKAIKEKVNIPVIALGGINLENGSTVLKAGADGIAVMSAIMASPQPYEITCKFKEFFA